jgi:hypothetical protein
VGLTNTIKFAELFVDFFGFLVNKKSVAPMVYQDSTAVSSLLTKGGVCVCANKISQSKDEPV